jgi:exonuclease III
MKILGWNCRGICNASTTRALRAIIKVQNPHCIFLCETKATDVRLEKLTRSIGFTEHVIISPKGRACGVCFFWSNSVNAKVIEFDVRTIVVSVHDEFCSWSLIGFYEPPYQAKKHKAWSNLHGLLQSLNNPWMCFGDFNVVMEEEEKEEGKRGSFSSPNFLKDLMFDLGAIDLGYFGNQFTWWNKRWGKGAIRE